MSWLDDELNKKSSGASWLDDELNKTPKASSWLDEELNNTQKLQLQQEKTKETSKTPIDQRLNLLGADNDSRSYVGMNIIPAYEEDTGLAKVGKGIVNYGVGGALSLLGNVFGAPQQALMQGTRATVNAIQGKPQDFSEMSFGKDILGAKEDNLLTMAISAGLDPATYIGGGILDDLSRAGQFGKGAVKGTAENLAANAATGQRATKNMAPAAQQATKSYLNAERNAIKKDAIKTPDVIFATEKIQKPLSLPAPAKQEPFTQVKYSIPKNPKGTTKWMETEFGNIPVKSKSGEGVASSKTILPQPKKEPYILKDTRMTDDEILASQKKLGIDSKQAIQPTITKNSTINPTTKTTAAKGAQNVTEALKNDSVYKEILDGIEGAKVGTDDTIKNIAPSVKDKSGLTLNLKDIYRNFRDAFGKNYEYVKTKYLDPFDASKKKYVDEVKANTDKVYNKVVKGLGIKKGSKESAAVQHYGEGVKIVKGEEVPYTEADLLKEFGAEKAAKIKQADAIFRQQYNELIDKVNAVRVQIYPNNAEKIIPKRTDYYRHFKEMAEGFEGLKNIFDTPSQIDPKLAGISEFTKPKSKWASYMQRRGKGEYTADAVGGFLDYIQPASYSIHIDPNIAKFRGLAKDLAEGTAETKNANNTIKWLNDFANSLSGKTNKYDRVIQEDIPGGRTAFRALNWLNSRVKANQVLGNFSSMVSQTANIPLAIARIKNPVAMTKGIGQTLAEVVGKGNKALKESQFINERYMSELLSRFNAKLLDKPKDLAGWLMQGSDKIGTLFTWNSAYNQAVSKGIKNPVKYADDLTRSIVAGRGIGEVPLLQQAKTFQLVAPFQLEVSNLWQAIGDMTKSKDFAGIALLLLGNYMFNSVTEKITGNRVTFDPIDSMMDALTEEDTNALKVGGRFAGEVLSNVPLGQTIASLYPEYGADVSTPAGNLKIPSRKELFGDNDPTRFGGGLLVAKGLADPLYKIAPPFAGSQIKKTVEGIQSVNKGMVEKDNKMRFPVDQTFKNYAQSALFGKYSTPEAREYFDKDRRPLSEKQTQQVGTNKAQHELLMRNRKIDTIKTKIKDVQKDTKLTNEARNKKLNDLYKQLQNVYKQE
jgi:hypothetical protein